MILKRFLILHSFSFFFVLKKKQVLANRPDIIREDYMNELCILQDDVPPFPNQVPYCPSHDDCLSYYFSLGNP